MSFDEFLIHIFNDLKIPSKDRKKLAKFINIEIKPILEKYKSLIGMDSELKV